MIEMLGVLAIIAVISIGSYSLYRRAVDTHKANSIFDDVNRFEFVISERIDRAPEGQINHGDFNPISGFTMIAYNEPSLQSHHIRVSDVPKSVCRIVLEKGEGKYVMYVKTHLYEGDTSICDKNLNEVRFYFGDTSDLTCSFPDKDAGEIGCSDGCLCPKEENECKPDIYKENYPNPSPILENTVCCPKASNIEACHNQCVDGTCTGENMFFNPKECACTCTDPDNMTYDADHNKCACGTDSNGVQLVLKNKECVCPQAGFTLVDGTCSKFDCRNGTTGNTRKDSSQERSFGVL